MIKKIIFPLFALYSFSALAACQLETYAQIIKVNLNQDEKIIKSTDCSSSIINEFTHFIGSAHGKLKAEYLQEYFKNEYKIDIEISPSKITVSHIKEIVHEKLQDPNVVIKSMTSLMPQSSINLAGNERISVQCKNCETPGNKNIAIEFNGKKHWFNTTLQIKRKSIVLAKEIMNLNQKLDPQNFEEKIILDNGRKALFGDIKNIKYYRLNRYLKKGDVLKRGDLSPRILVKYGDQVKLSYHNNHIKINTVAIAKNNGKYGDSISLINSSSKKKVSARVTGYNQAVIE